MKRPDRPTRAARSAIPVVLACAALLATSCLQSSQIPSRAALTPRSSAKLTPFAYYEDGLSLFIAVDARAARYVKEGSIFPVGIALANQSKSSLGIHRESLVLETSDGTKYPLASYEEFSRNYRRSRSDERLADTFDETLRQRFTNYAFTPWNVFPFKGQISTASKSIELGRRFWTRANLYFPIPETGIHGQDFALLVTLDETSETLVVRFSVD